MSYIINAVTGEPLIPNVDYIEDVWEYRELIGTKDGPVPIGQKQYKKLLIIKTASFFSVDLNKHESGPNKWEIHVQDRGVYRDFRINECKIEFENTIIGGNSVYITGDLKWTNIKLLDFCKIHSLKNNPLTVSVGQFSTIISDKGGGKYYMSRNCTYTLLNGSFGGEFVIDDPKHSFDGACHIKCISDSYDSTGVVWYGTKVTVLRGECEVLYGSKTEYLKSFSRLISKYVGTMVHEKLEVERLKYENEDLKNKLKQKSDNNSCYCCLLAKKEYLNKYFNVFHILNDARHDYK